MTEQFAVVRRIVAIEPHPDPERTRIEVVELDDGTKLVTGKHYRVGLLGIHLKPGCLIPGWLAQDLWLVGKKRAKEWFEVRSISIVGVQSPGLFCGQEYVTDGSKESLERADALYAAGGLPVGDGWVTWPAWREHWHAGMELDGYLGVVPVPVPARPFGSSGHMPMTTVFPISSTTGAAPSVGTHQHGHVTGPALDTHRHEFTIDTTSGNPPASFDHLVPRD